MSISFPASMFEGFVDDHESYIWTVDEEGNVTLAGLTDAEVALDALGQPSHATEELRQYKDKPFLLLKDEGVFRGEDYLAVAVSVMKDHLSLIGELFPLYIEKIADDLITFEEFARAARMRPRPSTLPALPSSHSMKYWMADYEDFTNTDPRRYVLLALQILVEATCYAEDLDSRATERLHNMLVQLARARAHLEMPQATPQETLGERAKQRRALYGLALKKLEKML